MVVVLVIAVIVVVVVVGIGLIVIVVVVVSDIESMNEYTAAVVSDICSVVVLPEAPKGFFIFLDGL